MSDYTYRKIITDREGVATGEKIVNVPNEVVKQIRSDAIDEFVKKIKESNQGHWRPTRYEHGEVVSETMSYDIGTIRFIAEQLKAGDNE